MTRRVLDEAQRRPVVTVFAVALVVRLVAIAVTQGLFAGIFFDADDTTYFRMAVDAAEGSTARWGTYQTNLYENTAAFMLPLTWIVALVGPSTVAVAGFVALLGALTAATVALLASRFVDDSLALGAGLFVALLPSQVAWSSLTLKDPMVWLLGVGTIVGFLVFGTSDRKSWWGAALAAISLAALTVTRLHSAVVIGWALVLAALWLRSRWDWRPFVAAVGVVILVPMVAGAGPGGLSLVTNAPPPSEQRQAFAQGAESAVEEPDSGDATSSDPQASFNDRSEESAGDSVLDELSHLPRGYSVMFLEPYPWHPRNDARFLLAKVDTLLWYPAVLLALIGAYHSLRRSTPAVLVVAAVAGLGTALALYEGNLGTAFRHRGELVWGVAVLAAIGWRQIRDRKTEPA